MEVYLERMRIAEVNPTIEPMPIRMEFGPIKREPLDFILGSRFGGFDVRRRSPFLIVTDVGPMPRHYHTDSRRKQKRARCKARRRARLPRRHWVRRAHRDEREQPERPAVGLA